MSDNQPERKADATAAVEAVMRRSQKWWQWLRVQYRCSALTAYGRGLRRRIREPFDPNDYVELERP